MVSPLRYFTLSFTLFTFLLFGVGAQAAKTQQSQKAFSYQKTIQLEKAWTIVNSASQVPVAVVDLDFQVDHPALKNILDLKQGRDYSNTNWSLVAELEVPHGSLVSGLIADQHKNGSWIIPFNLDAKNLSYKNMIAAIYDAIDAGAKVINVSMSATALSNDAITEYRNMARSALKKDVLLITAAGNFGQDLSSRPVYPAVLSAEFSNVITVGASDRQDRALDFSDYSSQYVSLFAPGENIKVISSKGFRLSKGTSEATPIVSGVAALIRQLRPDLTATEVKEILMLAVDKSPALAAKSVSGGRLNAYKALLLAQSYKLRE